MLLGGGGNPAAWLRGRRRARRATTARGDARRSPRSRRATTTSASRSRRPVSEPADALVGPDRDHLELGGRLRARLPGRRPAPLVAAQPGRRRVARRSRSAHRSRRPVTGRPRSWPWTASPGRRDRRRPSRPRRPREPRPARRPRPLLPAVAGRSVQRAWSRPTRPRRRPTTGPPGSAPSAIGRTRSAATSAACRGTSGRRSRAGSQTATRSRIAGSSTGDRGVNGLAQPFHHTILPLASAADRRTEIRWGLRDFALAVGPAGDRDVAGGGRGRPGHAAAARRARRRAHDPGAVAGGRPASRRAARTGSISATAGASSSRSTTAPLSAAISFDPRATADADRFIAEDVVPRLASGSLPDDEPPLVVIATDGELYGHHQPFRELFLQRLFQPVDAGDAAGSTSSRSTDGSARAGRPSPSGRSGSPSGPRGAATTASCAGAANARARPTAPGRARCGPPSSVWRRASTP